jgi:hypothetical protein
MLEAACSALVLLAGAYVLIPMFKGDGDSPEGELLAETELDRLLDRKGVVYKNMMDLELEYEMGRLSDADFKRLDAGYKQEAALILQEIEKLDSSGNLEAAIEKDISARKAKAVADPLKCPSCGAQLLAGKKYCADCGHRL